MFLLLFSLLHVFWKLKAKNYLEMHTQKFAKNN